MRKKQKAQILWVDFLDDRHTTSEEPASQERELPRARERCQTWQAGQFSHDRLGARTLAAVESDARILENRTLVQGTMEADDEQRLARENERWRAEEIIIMAEETRQEARTRERGYDESGEARLVRPKQRVRRVKVHRVMVSMIEDQQPVGLNGVVESPKMG